MIQNKFENFPRGQALTFSVDINVPQNLKLSVGKVTTEDKDYSLCNKRKHTWRKVKEFF